MKIIAIADTHGTDFISKIENCDVLLIGGDISPSKLDHTYYSQEIWFKNTFLQQLSELKKVADKIIFIGGNHDTYLSENNKFDTNYKIKNILPENVYYLCDETIKINGIKIYGSPWCNMPIWAESGPPVWNFSKKDAQLTTIYDDIPNDIDILLTHGPAFGFSDIIEDPDLIKYNLLNHKMPQENLGSKSLTEKILKDLNPQYVISGHIHSARRTFQIYKKNQTDKGIAFACASILDEKYKFNPLNQPIAINI